MRMFGAVLLLATMGAHAQVYVCDVDGHKSYSQIPCGKDAKEVETKAESGSITVSVNPTPDSLLASCKLMVRGANEARRLANEGIDPNSAQQRLFGFLRDHITNFKEVVQDNPGYYDTMQRNSVLLVGYGYNNARRPLTDQDLNNVVSECSRTALEHARQASPQTAPNRTLDKMM